MFGLGRNVTFALVGWLWADILLGLFVIFLAAASAPAVAMERTGPSIDPTPIELSVPVEGEVLLADGNDAAVDAEKARFADSVRDHLAAIGETRRIALAFAYGSHQDPAEGERLAGIAMSALEGGRFSDAVMKTLHDIVPGDRGSTIALELYVYR
ncbi:MAG: hypothetical protein ACRDGT_07750 [Candidatus Limnocylindria bacterium]